MEYHMGPDSLPDLSILKLDDDNYSAPSSAAQSVIFSVSGYGQAAGEAGSVCTRATSLFSLSEDDEDDHGDVNDNDEEPHMLPLTHEPLDPLDDRIRQVLDVPVGWLIDQLGEDLESVILSSRSGRRAKFLRPKSDTSKDLKLGRTTRRVDAEADRAASADPELPFIVGREGEKRPIQAVRRDDSARLRIQLTGHTGIEALEARFDPHGGRAAREEILRSLRERDTADGRRHSEGFEVIDTETSWKLGSVEVWVRPNGSLVLWQPSQADITLRVYARTFLESFKQFEERTKGNSLALVTETGDLNPRGTSVNTVRDTKLTRNESAGLV